MILIDSYEGCFFYNFHTKIRNMIRTYVSFKNWFLFPYGHSAWNTTKHASTKMRYCSSNCIHVWKVAFNSPNAFPTKIIAFSRNGFPKEATALIFLFQWNANKIFAEKWTVISREIRVLPSSFWFYWSAELGVPQSSWFLLERQPSAVSFGNLRNQTENSISNFQM